MGTTCRTTQLTGADHDYRSAIDVMVQSFARRTLRRSG